MSRPTKQRMVCQIPKELEFTPSKQGEAGEPVVLTVDEYETIRLIDKEGLSQEECSKRMGVARTTAQKIYESARKKLADSLVCGLPLKIEGGAFCLCRGQNHFCPKTECFKQEIYQTYQKQKGEDTMRIAVTYENGEIFQHFGRTQAFKVYETEGGKVVSSEVVSTNGQGHGALAEILRALQADTLICGGIGGGAQMALQNAGIRLYGGVSGSADDAVNAFLEGKLDFNPDVHCNHHNHEHGGEAHACGNHGCDHGSCHH